MANKFPISNYEIVKKLFSDLDFLKGSSWFFKNKWSNIIISSFGQFRGGIVWDNGTWLNGTWKDGYWYNGIWKSGIWLNGTWHNGTWKNGTWKNGIWIKGIWETGIWKNGVWYDGTWKDGTWKDGTWEDGAIWNPETKKYQSSKLPPNKVKWSLSYGN